MVWYCLSKTCSVLFFTCLAQPVFIYIWIVFFSKCSKKHWLTMLQFCDTEHLCKKSDTQFYQTVRCIWSMVLRPRNPKTGHLQTLIHMQTVHNICKICHTMISQKHRIWCLLLNIKLCHIISLSRQGMHLRWCANRYIQFEAWDCHSFEH